MGRFRRVLRRVLFGRPGGLRARLAACVGGGSPVGAPQPSPPAPAPAPPESGAVDVCAADALAPGEVAEFLVGDVPVALANVAGAFHALSNTCPHAGGPIGDGEVDGEQVVCPLHGWRFDVRTGASDIAPGVGLTVHRARVASGRVWVTLLPGSDHGGSSPIV